MDEAAEQQTCSPIYCCRRQWEGRTDAWRQARLGGAERLLTQIGRGGSGHWVWRVTPARLFLALACVVLFNYALFKKERKKSHSSFQ